MGPVSSSALRRGLKTPPTVLQARWRRMRRPLTLPCRATDPSLDQRLSRSECRISPTPQRVSCRTDTRIFTSASWRRTPFRSGPSAALKFARGPASDAMPPRAPRVEQRTENRSGAHELNSDLNNENKSGRDFRRKSRPDLFWCPGAELNHRHADFQSAALPTELLGHH